MPVNKINMINFRGIKVYKNEPKKGPVRAQQGEVYKMTDSQLDMLSKFSKTAKADFMTNGRLFANNFPLEKYEEIHYELALAKINQNREKIADMDKNLNDMLKYIENSIEILKNQVAVVDSIDEQHSCNKARIEQDKAISRNRNEKRGMDKIAGYNYERRILDNEFISKIRKEKQGENTEVFSSILFFGPKSNGKTFMTDSIAKETGCNLCKIKTLRRECKENFMQILLEKAEEAEKLFEKDRTRTIIFIDEIDKVINPESKHKEEFVDFIKSCSEKYHCSVFCATNHPLNLGIDYSDKEVFPIKLSFDPPNFENKVEILKHYIKERDFHNENIDYEELAKTLTKIENSTNLKYANGDIKNICSRLKAGENEQTTQGIIDHIYKCLEDKNNGCYFPPTITPEELGKFNKEYELLIEE